MQPVENHRNSAVRAYFQNHLENLAETIHEIFPRLTANHISLLGISGVTTSALLTYLIEKKNGKLEWKESATLSAIYSLFSVLDAFDGTLAREIKKKHPEQKQPEPNSWWHGQIIDYILDRLAEIIVITLGASRAVIHKDYLWLFLSVAAGTTNSLPSRYRAQFESLPHDPNLKVAEGGLGTRQTRFFLLIAFLLPRKELIQGVSAQAVIGAVLAITNSVTALQRRSIAIKASKAPQPEDVEKTYDQILATTRLQVSKFILPAFLGTVSVAGAYALTRRRKS